MQEKLEKLPSHLKFWCFLRLLRSVLEPNASMDEELAFSMQLENYTGSKDVKGV